MSHAASIPGEGKLHATITTSLGTMTALLHEDLVPKTVDNFVGLATGRIEYTDPRTGQPGSGPYYDGTIFHRVIPQFMVQAGDPTGTGRGGPGYKFEDEFHPDLRHDRPGILSMANAGPNTNGSQFFVTEVPTPHLDNRHSVFGVLVDGVELVSKITGVPKGPGDKPLTDVVLQSITFFRKAD